MKGSGFPLLFVWNRKNPAILPPKKEAVNYGKGYFQTGDPGSGAGAEAF